MHKIPWPPFSANHAYIAPKHGRWKMLKPVVKKWMESVALSLSKPKFKSCVDAHVHDIILAVRYFAPDGRGRDTDNVQKLYKDILEDAWGVNDSRFLIEEKSYVIDRVHPRIEIEIIKGEVKATDGAKY